MWVSGAAKYITTYAYSGTAMVTVVKPRGNRIDYTYNGYDEMTERRQKTTNTSSTDPSDIVESWTWSNHFVATYTDPLGAVTTTTRDSAGNPTRMDFPDVTNPTAQSAYKTTTYNASGQVTQTTDEEGKVRSYTYFTTGSEVGLLQKVEVDPSGLDLTTTYAHDCEGNITSVTDARGNVTTSTYDALRRLKQRTSPAPLSIDTKYTYDAKGNVLTKEIENLDKDGASVTANPWITTTYTYTVLDQVATITEEIDASTTRVTLFAYDLNGSRNLVTKPEGNKEKWTFNDRDLMASHTTGEGSTEASTEDFTYDDNGNLTVRQDGRGNDTVFTYDLFDRRTKTTDGRNPAKLPTCRRRRMPLI